MYFEDDAIGGDGGMIDMSIRRTGWVSPEQANMNTQAKFLIH